MTLPSEFTMRPFLPDVDLPRLARLYAINRGLSPTHPEWESTLQNIENTQQLYMSVDYHDPAQDRFVIASPENPDEMIGYATAWAKGLYAVRSEIYIAVHPDYRRQGLAKRLLQRALERAREQGVQYACMQADAENDEACHAFIQASGFRLEGASYHSLQLGADVAIQTSALPDGFSIRTYAEVNDIEVYATLMNQAYGDLWGHHLSNAEDQERWLTYFDPNAIFILFSPDNDPIGIYRVQTQSQNNVQGGHNRDSVDAPGIIPKFRNQRLYRSLLLLGVQWLRDHGAKGDIMMDSWGDAAETVAMFHEVGFETTYESIAYRLDL